MILKELSSGLKRWLAPDSDGVIEVRSGYRNEDGERTKLGIHQLLNFLEELHSEDFHTFLNEKVQEAEAAEKAAEEDED